MNRAPACLVCGAQLAPLDARSRRVCRSIACELRFATRRPEHVCSVCERWLAVTERGIGVCSDASCRTQWLVERKLAQARARDQARDARAHALRDASAVALAILDADTFEVSPVPFFDRDLIPATAEQREALRAALLERLGTGPADDASEADGSALGFVDVGAPLHPDALLALQIACTSCRGACCRGGGEQHAYLYGPKLRQRQRSHPDATPTEIVDHYMSHVGETSYRDSCLFHGAAGCTLTRELRSDTCNRYFCRDLKDIARAEARPRFIVAVSDDSAVPMRGAFVTATEARPVPVELSVPHR